MPLLWGGVGSAQPWPIKNFEVVNEDPTGDLGTVPADITANGEIETLLAEAAEQLERWGFPPPDLRLEPGDEAYRVYLVSDRLPAPALYVDGTCDRDLSVERRIFIGADQLSGEHLTETGEVNVVHELVHAVLFSMPFFQVRCAEAGDWIVEGQADAIGTDLSEDLRGRQSGLMHGRAAGRRPYSGRLPVPDGVSGQEVATAYGTSSFWRFLADEYARMSGGGVRLRGRNLDYSYLIQLHQQKAAARDCVGSGAACAAELEWLDARLQDVFGQRLRDLYPRFIQSYVTDGARDYQALGGTRDSLLLSFENKCETIELDPTISEGLQRRVVVFPFEDVSAQCWRVRLENFETPTVPVSMSVLGPPLVRQIAQLTAVRATGTPRRDAADVIQPLPGDTPRARWTYDLPNDDTTLLLLTNVAHRAEAATAKIPSLAVTFTALRSDASMATGSGSADTDIGDALPIELDHLTGSVASVFDLEVCNFTVRGRNTTTSDAVVLEMDHLGPIGVGTYPMSANDSPSNLPRDEAPEGTFVGYFALGKGNPMSGGKTQNFLWKSGVVEITSVSGGLVQGEVRGTGWRSMRVSFGDEPYGVPSFSIQARFAFTTAMFGRLLEGQADRCLDEG